MQCEHYRAMGSRCELEAPHRGRKHARVVHQYDYHTGAVTGTYVSEWDDESERLMAAKHGSRFD